MPRIAIAGFQHETNTFSPEPTPLEAFQVADSWPEMLLGDDVLEKSRGLNLPIAGFAEAATEAGAAIVPILWCSAEPAGLVVDAAFDTIADRILDGLRCAGPLDGIYLDLHGAMIAETHPDGEGELLGRIRHLVGPDLPISVSLDLHANVSAAMVAQADAICIYRTYPHLDMAQTGARAWARLQQCIVSGVPVRAFRQAPFLIPLHAQHTDAGPARDLYASLPDRPTEFVDMALGFTAGHPSDRAPCVIAHAASQAAADGLAEAALQRLISAKSSFDTRLAGPEEAVARAMEQKGARPIVLADVQDNPGAGASSDTTGLLRALVNAGAPATLMGLMHDPTLAAIAHAKGLGAEFDARIGGRSGVIGDSPFDMRVRVERLSDGFCQYSGDMYVGGTGVLGPSCVVSLPDSGADISIVVTSRRNQCLDLAHFTSFGLDPTRARIICVKSTAHFRAAFSSIAHDVVPVAAPGLFPCDLGRVSS